MDFQSDPDLEAFLHIVHVSDLHCQADTVQRDIKSELAFRRVLRFLRSIGKPGLADKLDAQIQDGLAGHDPMAHTLMCDFLADFANHPDFGGIDIWLVATGDLSALGDRDSIRMAMGWLQDYARILNTPSTLLLHGNHDAWPGKFPLFVSENEVRTHQGTLRQMLAKTWPDLALKTSIPHSRSRLLLNAINSTTGDRALNLFAAGDVALDPPWPMFNKCRHQLEELANKTAADFHPDMVTRDFRLLAVHHPVHYPPPRPTVTMSLRNDHEVADALEKFDQQHHRGKLAHLVLSGHTHATYPAPGTLPGFAQGQRYHPLHDGQLQLVTGSFSQLPRASDLANGEREDVIPQQCEILTFFNSPSCASSGQLLMERRVVGRPLGGQYKFLGIPGRPGTVESVVLGY